MFGRLLYCMLWPVLWFYLPLTRRVRVVVVYDNQVLLVRNWIGSGSWDFPGGGVKYGESAEDAVVREMREELGLHIGDIQKLHSGLIARKKNGLLMRLEYLQAVIDPDETIRQSWEIAAFKWVSYQECKSLDLLPPELEELVSSRSPMDDDTL